MNGLNIFELIKRLTESLPLDPAKVGEILGTPLERNPPGDTPVLMSYTQPAGVTDSPSKAVNLRIPDPLFSSGAGILGVTLKSDGGINSRALQQHYGYDYQRDVPSPRYPPETPCYYVYEQPWGTLSLGVTNDDAARLVSFVMEPKKPS
jgi:hypothetical protein